MLRIMTDGDNVGLSILEGQSALLINCHKRYLLN